MLGIVVAVCQMILPVFAEAPPVKIQEVGRSLIIDRTSREEICATGFTIQGKVIQYKTCEGPDAEKMLPSDHLYLFEKEIQPKSESVERKRNEKIIYTFKPDGKIEVFATTQLAFQKKDSKEVITVSVKRDSGQKPYQYDSPTKSLALKMYEYDSNRGPHFQDVTIPFDEGVLIFQNTGRELGQGLDVQSFADIHTECKKAIPVLTSSHTEYRRVTIKQGIEDKPEIRRENEICSDLIKKELKSYSETLTGPLPIHEMAEKPTSHVEPQTKPSASSSVDTLPEASNQKLPQAEKNALTDAGRPILYVKGPVSISKGAWITPEHNKMIPVSDIILNPKDIRFKEIETKVDRAVTAFEKKFSGRLWFSTEKVTAGKENVRMDSASAGSYVEFGKDGRLIQKQVIRVALLPRGSKKVEWITVEKSDDSFYAYDSKKTQILLRVDVSGEMKNSKIPFQGDLIWDDQEGVDPIEGIYLECNHKDSKKGSHEGLQGVSLTRLGQSRLTVNTKNICNYFAKKDELNIILGDPQNPRKFAGFTEKEFQNIVSGYEEKKQQVPLPELRADPAPEPEVSFAPDPQMEEPVKAMPSVNPTAQPTVSAPPVSAPHITSPAPKPPEKLIPEDVPVLPPSDDRI